VESDLGTLTLSGTAPDVARRSFPTERIAAGAVIAGMLLWFARSGLLVHFTGDDVMNIDKAWHEPYYQILFENIFYFTSGYRPMGSLVYRLLFDIAGIDPFPYRVLCFGLLLGNLYLLYRAAAAIAGKECAALAALLASFNSGLTDLYLNTGTIYDLLCFSFYFAALGLYVGVRQRSRSLSARELAAFLALYVCALNSKEMAVTLPLIVLGYEWMFQLSWRRRWIPALWSAAVTLPFVIGKFSASSPLVGNDGYRVRLGAHAYLRALDHFLAVFAGPAGGPLLALLGAIAIWRRRADLLFPLFFVLVTPLPVAFIPLRGGYAAYVTTFGIALFLARLIQQLRDEMSKWGGPPAGRQAGAVRAQEGGQGAARRPGSLSHTTFALCMAVLLFYHHRHPIGEVSPQDRQVRALLEQIAGVQPYIYPKWRILFVDDPFPPGYTPLFVLRLYYRAPDLEVERARMLPDKPDWKGYDCILTFDGDRLRRVHACIIKSSGLRKNTAAQSG
jgi:hypothetical protein